MERAKDDQIPNRTVNGVEWVRDHQNRHMAILVQYAGQ